MMLLCWSIVAPAQAQQAVAHVFWQEGCPYCKSARETLARMAAEEPMQLLVHEIELGSSKQNNALFKAVAEHFELKSPGVPLVVVGNRQSVGFGRGRSEAIYTEMISACIGAPCRDVVSELAEGVAHQDPVPPMVTDPPETVTLPWGSEIGLKGLSLPVLTVVLAAIDGFNPCAMWVLALLIGLLLGVDDSRRMWTLGAVFLLATGAMYFAVMAAWLNVVLWIGAVGWLRLAIGVLAIGAGGYYLREYWTNPEGLCKVTPGERKKSIGDAFRRLIEEPNLLMASLGVAALAIGVNLIELVCSAGVPAVYTQALAMHDLPPGAHYGYLLLYLAVFLLDDTVLFVVAMVSLRAVASTGRFTRMSHLLGGIVLLALGAVMILRPDLLAGV